jgi:predicted nucleotidyltransferase
VEIGQITDVLTKHPHVTFAYLVGSRAAGTAHARSDVDVAVFLAEGADPFAARLELQDTLRRRFGGMPVDLIVLNTAPVSLAGRLLASRKVLVDRDPPARHRYESLTAREFSDFRVREHRLLEAMTRRG